MGRGPLWEDDYIMAKSIVIRFTPHHYSQNHHKVRRNLFIIKGAIEVIEFFFGAMLDLRIC